MRGSAVTTTVGAEQVRPKPLAEREPPPKKKRGKNPETKIRGEILKYLRQQGWLVFHNLQGLGCYAGLSDLTAMKDGRIVWIEVKAHKGQQSREQWEFERDVTTNSGGEYLIARSVDDVKHLEVE